MAINMHLVGGGTPLQIQYMTLDSLIPYEKNPRNNKEAVPLVAESIKTFGFKNPIVIDKDNVIVAGHTRYKAAKKLKLKEVPCIIADDLTEEQVKAFRLADNKVAEAAEWDFDLLGEELDGIFDIDMEIFGFEFSMEEELTEAVEDDYEAELPAEPKAKLGDIYQLGRHRLMCGDSTSITDVEKLMNGEKADMVFTDPPYGINADKMTMGTGEKDFHRGDWDAERPDISIAFALAPLICIWGGNYFADVLPPTNDWLCWHKKNDGLTFSEFELAWTNFGRNCRHISHHWGKEKKLHVTMKPVEVMAWGIQQTKERCDNILDLFGGSGSTMIACEQLNRNCYMMELDPKYVDVIIDRWEQFTGEKAVLLNAIPSEEFVRMLP